ncbi:MAG TPA: GDP-mannose 4,6-dehydratase [Candidatus Angelobacter sp.]|nr:GDP-mannose 4,6-dehydratase [Candidatus Angelobacter sp.]
MRALITGVTGQDGHYLCRLLLDKGYEVHGMVRSMARDATSDMVGIAGRAYQGGLAGLGGKINFVEADVTDQTSLDRAMQQVKPDEVYHLAGQTFVPAAWSQPLLTMEVTGMGTLRMLEAVRRHAPGAKFLHAASAEMFGKAEHTPQTELTRLQPRNPYGAAKLFAHHMTINYRESYGMFTCSCIAFNHESPRRGVEFVTRKVSRHVAQAKMGMAGKLKIGNIEAQRDWGFAGDTVRAMWLMLQHSQPDDFVVATGTTHSVKQLLEIAFAYAGRDWRKHVEIDPALVRAAENDALCGDASKAKNILGWRPEVTFKEMVEMMVDADLALLTNTVAPTLRAVAGD